MSDESRKVALVTGAGSGLGEATAKALAAAGWDVACADLNGENAARVSSETAETGARSFSLPLDVSDERAVPEAVQTVVRQLGRLDAAVNCAAVDWVVSVDDMSIEQWDRAISVNLRGPFLVSKFAFAAMKERGGDIVNISSTAGVRAWGNAAAYHAAKWGLLGFSRGLGVEGRPYNIRVTAVIPGGMRTHWFDAFPEQGIPMPDMDTLQNPANVARTIVHALSLPRDSALQEVIITPLGETSWP